MRLTSTVLTIFVFMVRFYQILSTSNKLELADDFLSFHHFYRIMNTNLFRLPLFSFFVCLSLCGLNSNILSAQAPNELINQQIASLYDEAWAVARTQPERMLELLEEVKVLHAQQDKAYREGVVYYYQGIAHKNLSNFSESEKWFDVYINFQKQRRDTF